MNLFYLFKSKSTKKNKKKTTNNTPSNTPSTNEIISTNISIDDISKNVLDAISTNISTNGISSTNESTSTSVSTSIIDLDRQDTTKTIDIGNRELVVLRLNIMQELHQRVQARKTSEPKPTYSLFLAYSRGYPGFAVRGFAPSTDFMWTSRWG